MLPCVDGHCVCDVVCRDLEDLTKRTLRSADERSKSIECYLKSDIEKRLVVDGLSLVMSSWDWKVGVV